MLPISSSLRRLLVTHFLLELQFWFPVWLLFLTDRGFDLSTIVLADGVFRLTMVAFEVPLGIVGDRIGHKRAYLLVTLLAAVTYTGIALISNVTMLFAMWILWGIFWAMSSGTASAYAYELTVQEGYAEQSLSMFGILRAVANLAALLSHLLAGVLFSILPALPFAVSAVLALVALLIAVTLPDVKSERETVPRRRLTLSNGFGLLDQTGQARIIVFLLALALIYYWSPRILMQPLFIELSLAPIAVSAVYFSYSLAGIIAGLSASRLSRLLSNRWTTLGGMVLIWVGVGLIAILPGYWALLCFPLLGFGYYVTYTVLEVGLHQQVGNRNRATILSAVSFIGGVVIIFSRPALGLLADHLTASAAFAVWAVIGGGVVLLFAYLQHQLDFS